jgi:ABC-type polar amino acid transport system ATPase subunit
MLQIKNVSKSFGDKKIVDNISLEMPKGSVTILLGKSGVGKSTVLRILSDLEIPDTGQMIFEQKEINHETQKKEHLVGMVFQQFNLFNHKTVKQNITFPLEKVLNKSKQEADKIADALLEKFNLSDLADASVNALSGGQKQRLALARTLAMKPKIICMDEPTSALDPLLTSYVASIIDELASNGFIVVIATHDTVLIDKLDCMVHLMQDGKIIESVQSVAFRSQPEQFKHINNFVAGNKAF